MSIPLEVKLSILGIFAGAVGYLIVTFWFQPVLRYRAIRSQVISNLVFFRDAINVDGLNEAMQERLRDRIESNRRHSADLTALYAELPLIYRGWLKLRGANIQKAANNLMGLSNTYEYDDATDRISAIQRNFLVKPKITD